MRWKRDCCQSGGKLTYFSMAIPPVFSLSSPSSCLHTASVASFLRPDYHHTIGISGVSSSINSHPSIHVDIYPSTVAMAPRKPSGAARKASTPKRSSGRTSRPSTKAKATVPAPGADRTAEARKAAAAKRAQRKGKQPEVILSDSDSRSCSGSEGGRTPLYRAHPLGCKSRWENYRGR